MGKKPKTKPRATPAKGQLTALRDSINRLDRRFVALLNERARLVVRVGRIKRATGVPIYTPHREVDVLERVLAENRAAGGLLPDRTVEGIYRELMSGSFRLEQPPRIGYLGPPGTYSHLAAVKHFGQSVDFEDLHAIGGVFSEVARGHVDYGLVPIENSIGGGIVETLDAFQAMHNDVTVYAEVQVEVHHALLANGAPGDVGVIYSKPEVFDQCRGWLTTQYPRAELIAAASTSAAARIAAGGDGRPQSGKAAKRQTGRGGNGGTGVAAIGSVLAGEIYGLNVLFENIEDKSNNITRFFVISRHKAGRVGIGGDKTSVMFTTLDEPGALVRVLSAFERAGVNLTHIEKRPSGRVNWRYTFFVDAAGHVDDPGPDGTAGQGALGQALRRARRLCKELTVLGSYPRSRRIL